MVGTAHFSFRTAHIVYNCTLLKALQYDMGQTVTILDVVLRALAFNISIASKRI